MNRGVADAVAFIISGPTMIGSASRVAITLGHSRSSGTFCPRVHVHERVLTFTEESNALDYLEKAFFYIRHIDHDHTAWKWVILSLHGALYGFAIAACHGTDPATVTRKTKNCEQLISFGEALRRCQDPARMQMTVLSACLELTDNQKTALKRLKDTFRNTFEHFIPKSLHISLHELPAMCLECLPVVEFLALKTGNYTQLSLNERERISFIVHQSAHILRSCLLHKEAIYGPDYQA